MMKKIKQAAAAVISAAMLLSIIPAANAAEEEKPSYPAPNFKLYQTDYYTDEYVIAGYTVQDFGAKGDGVTDDTKAFQDAIDAAAAAGGCTIWVPEGRYAIKGNLVMKQGVSINGEIDTPGRDKAVKGTILQAYAGRGSIEGDPFIMMQPVTGIHDLAIWYPEQEADNIQPYPPAIQMGDPSVWGNDYVTVDNIEFVNAYLGYKNNPNMGGCPIVRNIYGTPLKSGIRIDSLADVGRIENCDFSPLYWENSGLPGAPSDKDSHRSYIYENGIAYEMSRNDWSYGRWLTADRYGVGFYALNSFCEGAWNGESRISNMYPNGENYGMKFSNCHIGVAIEDTSNSGMVITHTEIDNCENGFVARNTMASKISLIGWTINATDNAILNEGTGQVMMQEMDIESGKVSLSAGYASMLNCKFNNAAPQITLGKYSNASILGSTFKETKTIENNSVLTVTVDDTPVEMEPTPEFPQVNVLEVKPPRAVMYNAKDFGVKIDGVTDDAPAIQKALDKAAADGGGIVFLPPGFYGIKSELTVPSNVEFRGALDTGTMPRKNGSTLEIYHGKGQEGGATIHLQEKSTIRGICVDYPEQDYNDPIKFPYTVQGMGADVSIINMAIRNAYDFADLFTYRCDRAYMEYLCGSCWHIGVRVGAGSEDCLISNTQMNYNTVTTGYESKHGSWEGSGTPVKNNNDPVIKEKYDAAVSAIDGYMKDNYQPFILGDTKNILFYNDFIFPAGVGLRLMSENGTGPSGLSLGYGSDNSRTALLVEDIGEGGFSFINTQLVGINSHDKISGGFETAPSFKGKVTLHGIAIWGSLGHFVECNGGTIELQSGNFASSLDRCFILNNGQLIVRNAKINTIKERLMDGNTGNASFVGVNYLHNASMQEIVPGSYKEWTGNHDLQGVEFRRVKNPAVTVPLADLSISVRAGGTKLNMENQVPFIEGSTLYVPMEKILEQFGYSYEIDNGSKTLSVSRSDKSIMVTADSIYAIADGRKVTLSLPAKLMNGSMMVPSSFITDAIGSQISWSPKNRELTVNIPNLPDVDKNSTSPIVKLNTYSISATAQETANVASYAADGKMDTRWSSIGANNIMIDLGSKHPITSIKLAFFSGNPRVYPFTIEVSEDGKTWTHVLDTKNSGTTDQLEEYVLETPAYGRYVCAKFNGNNVNQYSSIWEFELYGR